MTADSQQALHILVAVDGSESAMSAVHWVAQLGVDGASLRCTLLNVKKPIMSGEVGVLAPVSVALDERGRTAADVLERAASILRAGKIPFETEDRMDDAAIAIASRAKSLGCDAIVIGRRGMGVVRAALLGSVSSEVVRKSGIPTIIVRASSGAAPGVPPRFLIAVDGSESAMRAATFSLRLAVLCHGEVDLVHVQSGLTMAESAFGSRDSLIAHWSGKRAGEVLGDIRTGLARPGVKYVEHVIASDDACSAILEVARKDSCSIIAMGTRGLGPISGLLLGSVAQGVLEHASPGVSAVALVQ